jgi:hypothetical protein
VGGDEFLTLPAFFKNKVCILEHINVCLSARVVRMFAAFHSVIISLNFLRSLPQKKLRHLKVEISARLTSLEGANIVKKSQLAEGQTAHRVKQAC